MERRLGFFKSKGKKPAEYNSTQQVLSGQAEKLPLIVIIIDELADLMMLAKKEIEERLCALLKRQEQREFT